MADLAVAESARRLAMDDQPDADAGADGHISEIIEAASAAPADFGERRTIDVGVETDRHGKGRFERTEQVGALPIGLVRRADLAIIGLGGRSEEHTSELQSLMRISYAVFCLKKKTRHTTRLDSN